MSAEPATRVVTAGAQACDDGARVLAAGGLVAFPTETVYGLGADATNGQAIADTLSGHEPALVSAVQVAVLDALEGGQ